MSARPDFLRAADIHARLGAAWPQILSCLGIAEQYLAYKTSGGRNRGKPGPCPICGGEDRYFFDNRTGRGDFFCRHCDPHAGDGFQLLMRVHGWSFAEARRQVLEAAGLTQDRIEISRLPSPNASRAAIEQKPTLQQPRLVSSLWRALRAL